MTGAQFFTGGRRKKGRKKSELTDERRKKFKGKRRTQANVEDISTKDKEERGAAVLKSF